MFDAYSTLHAGYLAELLEWSLNPAEADDKGPRSA